ANDIVELVIEFNKQDCVTKEAISFQKESLDIGFYDEENKLIRIEQIEVSMDKRKYKLSIDSRVKKISIDPQMKLLDLSLDDNTLVL
ncbi:MAG: hypothetical protein AAFO07_33975, partial [Bacteroidota bacterium]